MGEKHDLSDFDPGVIVGDGRAGFDFWSPQIFTHKESL